MASRSRSTRREYGIVKISFTKGAKEKRRGTSRGRPIASIGEYCGSL